MPAATRSTSDPMPAPPRAYMLGGGEPVTDPVDRSRERREVAEALRRDQLDLLREVILWQRWVRYGALAAFALLLGVMRGGSSVPLVPILVVAGAYTICVAGTAWYVVRHPTTPIGEWLPPLLLTADVAAMAALFYLTATPQQQHRVFLLGAVSVQLSVFYFGWRQGTYAAALVAFGYLITSLWAPAYVPGPRPPYDAVVVNVVLFALVAAVLIAAFDRFRRRMNELRLFCKLVEEGEPVGALSFGTEKRPDDLTLLARSFDGMRRRLAEQIGSDPLTSCLNRRALETRLRIEWRMAKRRGSAVAVLALDLDHFKQINDTRGHPVGDLVLQQLAEIMRATARDTDAVARLGGDEFVILLPDTGWQGALAFAERLRHRVDDNAFGPAAAPVAVTISVGVALARGTDPISPEILLEEADRALYKAKSSGRNRVFA